MKIKVAMEVKLPKGEVERSKHREKFNPRNSTQTIMKAVTCWERKSQGKQETTSKNNQPTSKTVFLEKPFLEKPRHNSHPLVQMVPWILNCFASIEFFWSITNDTILAQTKVDIKQHSAA